MSRPISLSVSQEQKDQSFINRENMHKGDKLYVALQREATDNTYITISDATNAQLVSTHPITSGASGGEFNLTSLPKGFYVVNLLEDGVVVDNIKIRVD